MSTNTRTLEIDADGLKLKTKEEDPFHGGMTENVTSKVDWDQFPLRNISIKGLSEIDAEFDEDGNTLKSVKFQVQEIRREEPENDNFFQKLEEETGISFNESSKEFEFNEHESDKQNFVNFVAFLFEGDYIDKDDLPYATDSQKTAYLINTEPVDKKGERMERTGEPVDGVYVPTHYAKRYKKNYMRILVNEFVPNHYIGD
jgi:hypothetical protein